MEFKEILIIMYSKLKDKNAIRDPFFLYSLMSDYCNKDFLTKDLCHKYLELNKKIDFVNIILDNGSKKSLDILHDKYRELKEFISLEDYKICIKSTILMIDNNYAFTTKVEKKINNPKIVVENPGFQIVNKELIKYTAHQKTVVIPNGVERLKYKCITDNKDVQKIIIPRSVKKIDYLVFENLPNLKEIYISRGVNNIEDYAFGGCNFPIIRCEDVIKPKYWSKKWNYSFYGNFFKKKIAVFWGQQIKNK